MNILAVYKGLDIAGYYMLGELSRREGITVYIAIASETNCNQIQGDCIPLEIPPIKSKISFKTIKALGKIITQYDIDIAYAISTSALSNVIFASRGNKTINIVGYSGTGRSMSWWDPTYYLAWLNPRVNAIVCVTPYIEKILQKRIKAKKLTVIPKPYDVAWVEDSCRNPKQLEGISEDTFKVINVATSKGRPIKGVKYFIEAATILNDPSVHFILVGGYDDETYALAQRSPAKDRIHFLGERGDAIYFLPKQDVFVLPSLRDAWSRAVREAMACGLPCIVTDIQGTRDMVINNQTGLIVEPASGKAIADAVRWMKDHEAERKEFGRRGRERIINDYPMKPYADAYEILFKGLMQQ